MLVSTVADPRSEAKGKYRTKLTVNVGGQVIMSDFATMNDAGFDIDSIGSYVGWYRIRDEARQHFLTHYA
jgi:hypothetical protein